MAIYLVNQGKTYKQERDGGFLWSPKLNSSGHKNAGYSLMSKVKQGDYILHNQGGKISAISIVRNNCYDAAQPDEVHQNSGEYNWNNEGYRIDTEYYDFDKPLINTNLALWSRRHPQKNSCFQINGKLKLRYLCNISEQDAKYLISEALRLQKEAAVKTVLYDALASFVFSEDEYDDADLEAIENIINAQDEIEKHYSGKMKNPQALTTTGGSLKLKPKRDPQIAANALQNANYKCEYNLTDRTFLRKSEKPYTEPHHLIPLSRYADFSCSVDVEENIVSLCSHCHNLLHYGRWQDKENVLWKLYSNRISGLNESGLYLTFSQLKEYYK
ncbi:MAG: HNH endonuclease [Pygmaiobacter massiliensis]